MTLPDTLYVVLGQYGLGRDSSLGFAADPITDIESAADWLGEAESATGQDAFVIRVDLADGKCANITEQCVAIIKERLRERGYPEAAE
jgi:hypothetical protein